MKRPGGATGIAFGFPRVLAAAALGFLLELGGAIFSATLAGAALWITHRVAGSGASPLLAAAVALALTLAVAVPSVLSPLADAQEAWRNVIATATQIGIPVPGFSAALSYYDALRAERLPAALIQGLRDFFGAHTYRRTDRDGTFHTLWAQDRSEESR